MKVLVALRVPGIDVHEVIQVHRRYLVELMQQWTRIKEDEGRVRPGPGAGGRRRAVPAGRGHPVAGRRRRAPQARRRRSAPAGAGRVAEAAAQGRGAAMSVLELRDVSKIYGAGAAEVHALRGVDLSVEAGAMVAVMGPSGSGKSTLLTIAGSLEDPTSGEVLVGGTRAVGDVAQRQGPAAAALGRVRVPGLQPAGRADRRRERGPAAGARRHGRREGPRGGAAGARRARPGRAGRPVPRRAVGRRAPAGGDRPRGGRGATPAARRRAVRGAGLGERARR